MHQKQQACACAFSLQMGDTTRQQLLTLLGPAVTAEDGALGLTLSALQDDDALFRVTYATREALVGGLKRRREMSAGA